MLQDTPIEKKVKDKLNRGRFVRAVVEEIKTIDATSSFTIGMYGKWGTGKTSLINLFREQLDDDGYFTTYFNPWRFKSEEMMVRELFLKILKGISSDKNLKSKSDQLGEFLKEYSKYLFFSDAAKNITAGVGEMLDKTVSLEDEKEKINETLSELANPLIIFIDDIDRLDNSEVQQIFKILKLTVDFNNLIYVLAFDEEMVAKSLSQVYGNSHSDGLRFIDKIIQLPLRIPRSNKKDQYQYTLDLLNDWIERKGLMVHFEKDKLKGFLNYYQLLHDLVVKTPRDSKRLINSVSFVEACLRDEINVLDIIIIETIRIFLPKVFDQIVEDSDILFSKPLNTTLYGNENRFTESQADEFVKKLEENGMPQLVSKTTLNFLFPLNDLFKRNFFSQSDIFSIHFQNQRLGVRDYFYRYLNFKIDSTIIPDKLFKKFLEKLNSETSYNGLTNLIEEVLKFSADNTLRRLMLNKNNLTKYGKRNVVKLLATENHFLSGKGMEHDLFQPNIRFPIEVVKEFEKKEDIDDTLSFIMKNNQDIYYLVDFIHHTKKQFLSPESDPEIQQEVEKIEKEFVERILEKDIAQFFKDAQDGKNAIIFEYFVENGKLNYLKEKILRYIKEDTGNVLFFLKSLINPVYMLNGKKSYTEIKDKNFERIEKYIDRNELENALKSFNSVFESQKSYEGRDIHLLTEYEQIVLQYIKFIKKDDLLHLV